MKSIFRLVVIQFVITLYGTGVNCSFAQDNVSVFGQPAPRALAKKFELVNDLVNKNQYGQAEPLTVSLLKQAPNLGALRWTYAKILYHKKQYLKAYNESKKATRLLPGFSSPYICLANSALAIGKPEESLAALKTFLRLSPNSSQASEVRNFVKVVEQEVKNSTKSKIKSPAGTYLSNVTAYGVTRFTESKMPLKVYIDNGLNIKGYRPALSAVLKASFKQWQTRSNNLVRFSYVNSANQADIECHWTDDVSKLDIPSERGRTRYTDSEFGRVCAEILILTQADGAVESDLEVHRTALHEIGHALGMNGHSDSKSDVMFPTVEVKPVLSPRDIQTLKALYKLEPTKAKASKGYANKKITFAKGGKHRAAQVCQNAVELLNQKKFKPAVEKLREAIKIDPGFQAAYYNLSVALNGLAVVTAKAGDLEKAETHAKEACDLMRKFGKKKSQLSIFLKNYIIILKANGKADQAKELQNQLDLAK